MTPDSAKFPIAAIVLTYNEEKNIETCLKSVVGWCREVFIVDSGSHDRTKEICRKYTDGIYEHRFEDHPSQWHWALNNLPVSAEWVLPLDADYIISDGLKREMIKAVNRPEPRVNGYYARHQYYFWGVPMRGFKPYSLCLFRRNKTGLEHGELVDHRFVIRGETKVLAGVVYEINNNEWDIDVWTDKHQKYSTRLAIQEVLARGGEIRRSLSGRLGGNPDERIIWAKSLWENLPLYFRPLAYFFYRYFFRLGFLDGKVGFVYHFLHAFWFRLMVDIKISQLQRRLASGELTLQTLKEAVFRQRG